MLGEFFRRATARKKRRPSAPTPYSTPITSSARRHTGSSPCDTDSIPPLTIPPSVVTRPSASRLFSDSLDLGPRKTVIRSTTTAVEDSNSESCTQGSSGSGPVGYATPKIRKVVILLLVAWCNFSSGISSTSLLGASFEIAEEMDTTPEMVNISTAVLLGGMALSGFIWSPIQALLGRRVSYNGCLLVLLIFTALVATAPTMTSFMVTRALSGLQGSYFQIAGQKLVTELFPPENRGTAMGVYLAIGNIGPPLGPIIASLMVKYTSWRYILWLQASMIAAGYLLGVPLIPAEPKVTGRKALAQCNPAGYFRVMAYPNVILVQISCGLMAGIQYSLLAAPRYLLKTHLGVDDPLLLACFYAAPTAGFLVGTIFGGPHADITALKWEAARAIRLPQDRLRSVTKILTVWMPLACFVYGYPIMYGDHLTGLLWAGLVTFIIGCGLLASYPSLNTYCNEVLPEKQKEVVGGRYLIHFGSTALATTAAVPTIQSIGIVASGILAAGVMLMAGILTWVTAKYGKRMQDWKEQEPENEKQLPL